MIEIALGLAGFAATNVASSVINKLTTRYLDKFSKHFSKQEADSDSPSDQLPSKIENIYPITKGTTVPWLTTNTVSDGFRTEPLPVSIAMEKKYAILRMQLKNLDDIPFLKANDKLFSVQLNHTSFLEIEDITDLKLGVPLSATLLFDTPIKKILENDIAKTSNYIEVPLEFISDVRTVNVVTKPMYELMPLSKPKSLKEVDLAPREKKKFDIPYYHYLT